jgi:hypothetical protein
MVEGLHWLQLGEAQLEHQEPAEGKLRSCQGLHDLYFGAG